jgi:hypothetical protein
MFICNHCPLYFTSSRKWSIANDYRVQGLGVIAISSNDVVNFRRTPQIDEFAFENNLNSYLLMKRSSSPSYDACTPWFLVRQPRQVNLSTTRRQSSWKRNTVKRKWSVRCYWRRDLQQKKSTQSKPSMGCNIKWSSELVSKKKTKAKAGFLLC